MDRRKFVRMLGCGAGLAAASPWLARIGSAAEPAAGAQAGETRRGEMIYRTLGRTGEQVSVIGLGGAHIGYIDEAAAQRIMHEAIERGITFMDNAWDYNRGKSEERMGRALKDGGKRDKVFLMTKIDGRGKALATSQLNDCLHRLQTDRIDLVQFHEITRPTDIDPIYAPGGALEALMEAKKAGKLRYIGFTGHKDPSGHLRMLRQAKAHGVRFDTVQMPLNVMDAHYRSFEHLVLPELVKENIGVLGMKSLGMGRILNSGTVTATECLHYAMSLPTAVVITGIDKPDVLQQAFDAVKSFKPLDGKQVAELLSRTAPSATDGEFELYKAAHGFDGPHDAPQWYGLATA